MEHTGALKALALRHPRENTNHNNGGGGGGGSPEKPQQQSPSQAQAQGQAADKQQQPSPGASLDSDSGSGSGNGTPTPLKVLARFRRGLASLRLADRRVLPYLFVGVHQRLATGIVTLVLRDLNMADEVRGWVGRCLW
jgi:hypothetical protein